MSKLEVEFSAAQSRRLEEEAARLGVTPRDLVLAAVSDLLQRPGPEFREVAERVLGKNSELYRRLA